MYTRTGVQGSGFGAPAASRPTRDPPALRGELGPPQAPKQDLEAAPERPSRESTEAAGPRFTGAYTLIAPNEKRRNEIQQMAAKELEELERWKKQQREKSINLPPMTLGGSQSEAEVRQRQQLQLIQSKYQKKLKKEECVRIKKEAEEAEVQKMRAAQREKSNKLEEKKRLQENLRRETFREYQQYKTAEFLRRFEADLPRRGACPVAGDDPQPSAWARRQAYMDTLKEEENQKLQKMKEEQHQKGELLEFKRQQQEEERTKSHQAEHRRWTFANKGPSVKAMVFPVVMYGCESWTVKKAERQRIDAFELRCWRRLLRVPWTARRSNQSILKEISPEYSLEGLMLKLKLQYFGLLMQRTDSLEKTVMLGKIEGRRREQQRMRWLDGITDFDGHEFGVNNAFLDRLQGKSQPGGLQHFGGYWNMNSGNSWDT